MKLDVWKLRCFMHQLQIPRKGLYMMPFIKVHNQLYCLSHLRRVGRDTLPLKHHMHYILANSLHAEYSDANRNGPRFAEDRLELLFSSPSANRGEDVDDEALEGWAKKRQEQAQEASAIFTGSWLAADIPHHCTIGPPPACNCRSEQDRFVVFVLLEIK